MSNVRIGFVSKYDETTGMAAIYYPDRCHQVTSFLPVFSPFGLAQKLKKDDVVLVLHLSNGTEAGIVMGIYDGNSSGVEICVQDGSLVFKDKSGTVSLSQIIDVVNRR